MATYIFMLPGAIAYTYLGYIGKEAATGGEGLIQKGLMALALVAVIIFIPRFISALRQGPMLDVDVLKQKLDNNLTLVGANHFAQPNLLSTLHRSGGRKINIIYPCDNEYEY